MQVLLKCAGKYLNCPCERKDVCFFLAQVFFGGGGGKDMNVRSKDMREF